MARNEAGLVLLIMLLFVIYGLASMNQAFPERAPEVTDGEDVRMYRSVIERTHNGEGYYEVVGDELGTRGYPTQPFLNWRLPTMSVIMGFFPSPVWGQWVLVVLGLVTLVWWFQVIDYESGFGYAMICSVLLCGHLLICLNEQGYFYHELWAGMLIAFSLAAHARQYIVVSLVAGVLATFIRELAFLYLLIMFAVAWNEKRNGEVLGWLGGITIFSVALVYHASIVSGLVSSSHVTNESWIQFGGWSFVLSTGYWNAYLMASPKWVLAVILPLALVGLAGWRGPGVRSALVLAGYFSVFLIAGRANNTYWGLMYASLVPLGVTYAIPAVVDLVRTCMERTHHR
ncbi:MAG: hypothetical protein NPIRA02_28580 [Nitrospirales bacterium]|nr:MAG: hypothetical protein NPIRA02_28580 [Nitrospirales bacterium]